MGTITIATAVVQAKAGKVRLLATTTGQRLAQYPDIPTVAESVPGFAWAQWAGYLAPAKTPISIVNRISAEFQRAVKDPEISRKLLAVGNIPVGSTPEQFRQQIAVEANRWKNLVKDIDFSLED
jgi:tripartite-type tricarboxylate transporter receptor subunit TctC